MTDDVKSRNSHVITHRYYFRIQDGGPLAEIRCEIKIRQRQSHTALGRGDRRAISVTRVEPIDRFARKNRRDRTPTPVTITQHQQRGTIVVFGVENYQTKKLFNNYPCKKMKIETF